MEPSVGMVFVGVQGVWSCRGLGVSPFCEATSRVSMKEEANCELFFRDIRSCLG